MRKGPSVLQTLSGKLSDIALAVWSIFGLFLLLAPVLIVVPMSFSAGDRVAFPPQGFSFRWFHRLFSDPLWVEAFRTSVILGIAASTIALLVGSLAAYALVRGPLRAKALYQGAFIGPMVVPPVVIAVAAYFVYARLNLLGTLQGLVLSHATLALPFVVLIMSNAVSSFDVRIEQAGMSLGASRFTVLRRIVAPALAPHLLVSWLFAFAVSFDEVVITFFVGGSQVTIPKKMFVTLRNEIDPTVTAVSTLLIGVTVLIGLIAALLLQRRILNVVGAEN